MKKKISRIILTLSFLTNCSTEPNEESIQNFLHNHYWIYRESSNAGNKKDEYTIEKCELSKEQTQSYSMDFIPIEQYQIEFKGMKAFTVAKCILSFKFLNFPRLGSDHITKVNSDYVWLPVSKKWTLIQNNIQP